MVINSFFKKKIFCFITDTHDLKIAKIKIDGNIFYLKLDAIERYVFNAKVDESIIGLKRYC